jgi:hypothetical protein
MRVVCEHELANKNQSTISCGKMSLASEPNVIFILNVHENGLTTFFPKVKCIIDGLGSVHEIEKLGV